MLLKPCLKMSFLIGESMKIVSSLLVMLFSISVSFAGEISGEDAYGGCPKELSKSTTYLSDYIFADVILPSHMDIDLVVVARHERARVKIIGGEFVKDAAALECSQDALAGVEKLDTNFFKHTIYGDSVRFRGIYKICVSNFRGDIIETVTLCNSNTGD